MSHKLRDCVVSSLELAGPLPTYSMSRQHGITVRRNPLVLTATRRALTFIICGYGSHTCRDTSRLRLTYSGSRRAFTCDFIWVSASEVVA